MQGNFLNIEAKIVNSVNSYPAAVERFKNGNFRFDFDAQATAVAIKSGVSANAKFANGVAVFTMAGLMYEASIRGQKFSYQNTQGPLSNQ